MCSNLQRNRIGSENPSDVFRFLVEERIQCCQTRKVRYMERVDYLMQLPVAMEAATNKGKGSKVGHLPCASSSVKTVEAEITRFSHSTVLSGVDPAQMAYGLHVSFHLFFSPHVTFF